MDNFCALISLISVEADLSRGKSWEEEEIFIFRYILHFIYKMTESETSFITGL